MMNYIRFEHHAEVTIVLEALAWKSPHRGILFIVLVSALIGFTKRYLFAVNILFEFPEKFALRQDDDSTLIR